MDRGKALRLLGDWKVARKGRIGLERRLALLERQALELEERVGEGYEREADLEYEICQELVRDGPLRLADRVYYAERRWVEDGHFFDTLQVAPVDSRAPAEAAALLGVAYQNCPEEVP